ncbi:MAG TPA: helix-turn-helix domain-containing protein [Solirubrobacter sp.]|nr:helix-turn-helix domain-containing protein [Solirubrobacter sp.]
MADDAPSDRIQALSRGMRILEHVHAAGRPLGVKEIAAALGLNLATTYHLVNTLLYEGYLERGDDHRLRPGRVPGASDGAITVGVRRVLGRAAFAIDDVAVLARLTGAQTRVAAAAEVPGATCTGHYPPGAVALSHLLAAGRVILAHMPPDGTEEALETTRRAATLRHELFDEAELRAALDEAAELHYSVVVGDGDACVGVPIFGGGGAVLGAVAVVAPARRVRRALDRFVCVASRAAGELSSKQ